MAVAAAAAVGVGGFAAASTPVLAAAFFSSGFTRFAAIRGDVAAIHGIMPTFPAFFLWPRMQPCTRASSRRIEAASLAISSTPLMHRIDLLTCTVPMLSASGRTGCEKTQSASTISRQASGFVSPSERRRKKLDIVARRRWASSYWGFPDFEEASGPTKGEI